MISEDYRQMLSAYIDGELSARRRKAVLRLLRRSAEARALLLEMREDAQKLRLLPKKKSDPDFHVRLMQVFAERQSQAVRERPSISESPTLPLWLGLVAAALVFLVFGIGSYLYFSDAFRSDQTPAANLGNE